MAKKVADGRLRRLVVEVSLEEVRASGQRTPTLVTNLLENVELLETLRVLRIAPGELSGIIRIKFKDRKYRFEEIFRPAEIEGFKFETELLDEESDTVSTYFVKSSARTEPGRLKRRGRLPYVASPFEYKTGRLRVAYIGSSSQIRQLLTLLARLSKQSLVRYRVVSLGDAKLLPNWPIARLTDKQRRVLITAYRFGYYDVPRRISAEELASKLNLVKSTFSAHVRKAERRLLTEMLGQL